MRRCLVQLLARVCACPVRTASHSDLKSFDGGALLATGVRILSKSRPSAFRWASLLVCRRNVVYRRDVRPPWHFAKSVCLASSVSAAAQHARHPSPVVQWTSHVKRGSHAMRHKVRHLFFLAKNMHCKQEQVASENFCACSSSISSSNSATRSLRQRVP